MLFISIPLPVLIGVVVIIFSETSSTSSWVKGELNIAFEEQKTIIPFRLDSTPLKGQNRLILAVAAFFIIKKIDNKNKEYFKQIVFNLMKEKMEDVVYEEKNQNYDVSFKFNNTNFFIKVYEGGPRKGFIMTNPTTIFDVTYTGEFGPSKSKEIATKLTPFLVEPLKGIKVILVKGNMLRMTKYINENEIVEIKYNVPAFNTYIVQEKDFSNFIELLKTPKKK